MDELRVKLARLVAGWEITAADADNCVGSYQNGLHHCIGDVQRLLDTVSPAKPAQYTTVTCSQCRGQGVFEGMAGYDGEGKVLYAQQRCFECGGTGESYERV